MPNMKGLEPFPRAYSDDIPAHHIPYLEDIRRSGNAVRVLRRHGKATAAARLRFKHACEQFDALLSRETWEREHPPLF